MKVCTPTLVRCRFRQRPDAGCRKPPRCLRCGNPLAFAWQNKLCNECAKHDATPKGGERHV
jgi:hypothetical protein